MNESNTTASVVSSISSATLPPRSSSSSSPRIILKVLLIGNSSVGKTSLLTRIVDDHFVSSYKSTIGTDMKSKDVLIDNTLVTLQLYDTAGAERFKSLSSSYYRGSSIVFFVFDLNEAKSFDELAKWRDEFIAASGVGENNEDFPCAVLGNKSDLSSSRVITQRKACSYCTASSNLTGIKFHYYEVSALDATNVMQAMMDMARKAYAIYLKENKEITEQLQKKIQNQTILLTQQPQQHNQTRQIKTQQQHTTASSSCCS